MPTIYANVQRLIAIRKILERRGSLDIEETIGELPQFYFDHDQELESAQRTARRDFENLIALGFPIVRVKPRKPRTYPATYYWGSAPPSDQRGPRKFKYPCDHCGKDIYLLFPQGGRHLCAPMPRGDPRGAQSQATHCRCAALSRENTGKTKIPWIELTQGILLFQNSMYCRHSGAISEDSTR